MHPSDNDLIDVAKQKASLEKLLFDLIRRLEWSLRNIEKAFIECQHWQKLEHQLILLQANLYRYEKGMNVLIVEDWENEGLPYKILLDPHKSIAEQLKAKSLQVKKKQRGLALLEQRRQVLENRKALLSAELEKLLDLHDLPALNAFEQRYFPKKASKELPPKKLSYRIFWSESGLRLLVGKGARGNALVTFSLAAGSDIWCHVQGYAGAHVVLQVKRKSAPDQDALLDALQLALTYSKAPLAAEVVVSEVKHIRPLGKKEFGKVQISKHTLRFVEADRERLRALKERIKPNF